MATANPFDLLGDDDAEDPSVLIAAQLQKIETKKSVSPPPVAAAGAKQPNKTAPQPKLPSKPLPPAQAVREAKSEYARGGRGGGRGYGRSRGAGGGPYRDSQPYEYSYGNREMSAGQSAPDEGDTGKTYGRRGGYGGPRGPFRGGHRGGSSNGEVGEGDSDRPRRPFDRRPGTGPGNEIKREGAGQGNWGTQSDNLAQPAETIASEAEKGLNLNAEKPMGEEDLPADGDKEDSKTELKVKEPEDKEMTLEEYEKIVEEKRKVLQALKTNERKVDAREFASMQQLSNKKTSDDIFIKLGSEKDKKKELAEKEERAKKSVSINEFLKPADGEKYYTPSGRGRGRGRSSRGGYTGGNGANVMAPSIEDPGQFPTLGGSSK